MNGRKPKRRGQPKPQGKPAHSLEGALLCELGRIADALEKIAEGGLDQTQIDALAARINATTDKLLAATQPPQT